MTPRKDYDWSPRVHKHDRVVLWGCALAVVVLIILEVWK